MQFRIKTIPQLSIFLFFTTAMLCTVSAQNDSISFKVTDYLYGNVFSKTKTIAAPKQLGIQTYKDVFYLFYDVPADFVQPKLRNDTIRSWGLENAPKSFDSNWFTTSSYDANGRLVRYTYSGCVFCSQMPWGYTLTYNNNNQIVALETYLIQATDSITLWHYFGSFTFSDPWSERLVLNYDSNGNIINATQFDQNGLLKTIALINPQ